APPELSMERRLERLAEALLDSDKMRLEYSWGYTGTAREVFTSRRANCLAFTNLFLGMAREVGVEVHFVSIENVETFRREGDLVVISDHIAVAFGDGPSRKIFDFSENPSVDLRVSRRVSDLEAIAMFHSNRGAEALQAGAVDSAVEWLELAVAIDPELPTAWVNYGVALRRAGLHSSAEDAYKQAIAVDPRSYSAYHNLAALLRSRGREEEAAAYEATLAQAPSQNPYTYLSLGDLSLKAGQLEDAERYYRRAVSLAPDDDAECYAALGHLAVVNGDLRLARRMLRKAERAGGASPRAQMLAEALHRHKRPR
ncbi:MAG: tetratricopeptide repeat protein, partial [Holophagales bacterium]|nr:tetratricopeptide repeat protein [Holophagales bacterium]